MKQLRVLIILSITLFLACVSPPIYNTATTTEGLSVGAGVAYQTASRGGYWYDEDEQDQRSLYGELTGVRPDFILDYGIRPTFSVQGRFAAVIPGNFNWDGNDDNTLPDDSISFPLPMVGVGLKLSTPGDKIVNLALRMDLDIPNIAVFTPMIGFSTKQKHEFLTLGFQTNYLFIPQTMFLNIHPFKGAHIYGGLDFLQFNQNISNVHFNGDQRFSSFCIGVAYAYNFGLKEPEVQIPDEFSQ